MTNKIGRYLCIEGMDGAGKSTIIALVTEWLKSHNIDVVLTRHPGSTGIGKELRKIVKESSNAIDENTEALIMAADNSAFINQILIPSLKAGAWVLADRNNFISSMAYQIASGCSFSQLDKIHAATSDNPPLIDLLLILSITPETHTQRIKSRPKTVRDNFEDRGNEYSKKVMDAYESLLTDQTGRLLRFVQSTTDYTSISSEVPRCLYINANKSINEVLEDCKKAICSMMPEICPVK
jgi:dTMP kinase